MFNKINKKIGGICIVPNQPFRAAIDAESRVCLHSRQAYAMSAHVLLHLSVNSTSERTVNSMSPLGFEPVIFGMLAHLYLSDHSNQPSPHPQ
jgi:hypothetical protein